MVAGGSARWRTALADRPNPSRVRDVLFSAPLRYSPPAHVSTTSQTPDERLGREIPDGDFASPEVAAASGQVEIRARGYW